MTAIEEFYLNVAPEFADLIVGQILKQTRRLELFPLSGRMVPEVNDSAIREVIYRNYRIIYYYNPNEKHVDILTVFHLAKEFGS